MTTQYELTQRDQEIERLEDEIIKAWGANGGRIPEDAFGALLTSAKIACDPSPHAESAAERAMDRLRRAAEAVRSTAALH